MRHVQLAAIAAIAVLAGPVNTLATAAEPQAQRAPVRAAEAPPSGYLLPPKVIVDILDAPPPPAVELSPTGDVMALLERTSMPTLAELSQPMLRLGGVRINPRTNGPHRFQTSGPGARYRTLSLKGSTDGVVRQVTLPANPAIGWIGFSPDGARFAFTQTRDTGIELWLGDTATGAAKALTTAQLNASLGAPCEWAGRTSLLCGFINGSRGAAPAAPAVPSTPNIQESRGKQAPVRTYQDLLQSAYDEALFEYYATSQLAMVDATTGQRAPVGKTGIFDTFAPSPDGQFVLVARVQRPFSWLVPYDSFPTIVEIWDRKGVAVKTLLERPLANSVAAGGAQPGPRAWRWQGSQPATLAWAEALDGGDPKTLVPHRDKVMTLAAPFTGAPVEFTKTEWRFANVAWTDAGVALITENDRTTRATRTWLIDAPGQAPRKLWERRSEDSYANPGTPLRRGAGTAATVRQAGDNIYLTGAGSTPQGDRPFLDRLNLKTLASERVFQSPDASYETVVGLITDDAARVVTRGESRTDAPNVFARDVKANERIAMTTYADPAPPLQGAMSQLVTYQRKDGVQLRATIYTPPGWTPAKGPLPALLWAYPREFTDADTAGQVTGSPFRFTTPGWSTLHLLFLTQGYAVIDDPTMPIIGPGETANDTYIEQLVSSAQAAVDKAVDMGIVDRDRVVAGGHSYGAFMTANLLAHSDIFRAGLARSGAYNRTLTPFGFQSEQRTFWEAPQLYSRMSPFNYADKVNEPILLIHGEADDNSGTFPVQSERFYMALKGHGATVRYVTLPHEAHGYVARESLLHTVAEMLNWANEWARDAKPRATANQR